MGFWFLNIFSRKAKNDFQSAKSELVWRLSGSYDAVYSEIYHEMKICHLKTSCNRFILVFCASHDILLTSQVQNLNCFEGYMGHMMQWKEIHTIGWGIVMSKPYGTALFCYFMPPTSFFLLPKCKIVTVLKVI